MRFHFIVKDRSFYRRVLQIAIPIALQSLITIGVNMMDTIMLGSMGETQLSASSLANQFVHVYQIFCMGLGMGASVLIARFWGMKDKENLRKSITIMLRLTLILSALFTLATLIAPRSIMRIYTPDEGIIEAGKRYMRWVVACYFFHGLTLTLTLVLRNVGLMKVPLYTSIGAFFVNVFFNWVFIFGKFGAPALGVIGAAVGTVIARTFEFLFICGYFVLFEKNFGFRLRHAFLRDRALTRQYIRFSLPVMISDTLLGIGLSLTGVIVGHMREEFITAHSIVNAGNHMITVTNTAMAAASAVIIGNTIGEGDKERAYREGIAYIVIAVLLGAVYSLIIFALKGPYLTLYSVSDDARAVCMELFRYLIYFSPLEMLAYCVSKGVLRGSGDTRFLMVADIVLLWVFSLPLGYLAAHVWKMAPFWVYFFLKLEYAGKGLLCTARFLSKKGIKVVG